MEFDLLISLCRYFVIIIYSITCFISIIFAFFIDRYQRLEEILEFEIINMRTLTIFESNKITVDEWLFAHNRIVGSILFLLSLFDAYMLNNLILRL